MISVLGAGAFGTSLAIALSRDGAPVTLWSRNPDEADAMQTTRQSGARLPDVTLPENLSATSDLEAALSDIILLAVPTKALADLLAQLPRSQSAMVACCKGVDPKTGFGPTQMIKSAHPDMPPAILTGPSFAADISRGLPTALVLASADDAHGAHLQNMLTRPLLRLYRTTDVTGAELGGALKNVVAIAAGIAIGAGLGDSARASVISRGFAELTRYGVAKGAKPETLNGLSGLGDLVLTCTSPKSRNFSAGLTLGQGQRPDPQATIEGMITADAVAREANAKGLDLPLITATAAVINGELDIQSAINTLMSRPVGEE